MTVKLDAREKRFVAEYLVSLDPQEAAIAAGYAVTTAHSKSYGWVCVSGDKPHVYEAVQKAMEKRSEKTMVTAEQVLEELAKIGFANTSDYIKITDGGDPYIDLSELTREQAAAISEIIVDDYVEGRGDNARDVKKIRIKFHDKRAALESMGKHLGMFKTKVEVSGPGGAPLAVDDLTGLSNEELAERLAIIDKSEE